jgi:mannosyl-3-phosphoglycerate phosphatase
LLAPRHLIFTALESSLLDPRTDSFSGTEEALSELDRRHIPFVLLTARTRAEIEPVRRKLGHTHPFITENGGGIFFPDGYFNLRIPGAVRAGRYLSIAQGRPYVEVCEALDEIAGECGVGVAGFHHMNSREIAENTGLRPRSADLARDREFDEPFFFTSANEQAIARFVEAARRRGFDTRRGPTFWRLSAGCNVLRAVRAVAQLFREDRHIKLRLVGIGGGDEDLPWLRAMDDAVLLKSPHNTAKPSTPPSGGQDRTRSIVIVDSPGPSGWNRAIQKIIR